MEVKEMNDHVHLWQNAEQTFKKCKHLARLKLNYRANIRIIIEGPFDKKTHHPHRFRENEMRSSL